MPSHRPQFALPLCLLGSLAWTGTAFASGFSTARFGGEHGNPITSNPTAVYYNPAGIADSEGVHIFADGNLAFRSASYSHAAAKTDDVTVPGANTGEATLFDVAAAPMLGATAKFGQFAVGLGVYVPFGGSSGWDQNNAFKDSTKYAGPVDGVQRWHSIEGILQSTYLTLSAGYRFPGIGLSLGISGNLIRSTLSTVRAHTITGRNTISTEGRSYVDVSGVEGSFAAGAMLEAMPKKLWIGASYQARPNVAGGMKLTGTLQDYFAAASSDDVAVYQDLPDIVRLGVRFVPKEGLELRLFGDLTRWSSLHDQCIVKLESADADPGCSVHDDGSAADGGNNVLQNIPRRWHDAWGVRAGISYWAAPPVELFAGLGYDSDAIPDSTLDPSLSDFDDVAIAVGGRFEVMKRMHVAASYTHLFYVDRDTTGKSISAGLISPSAVPDSGGNYSQTIGVVNVNVDVAF